MSRWTGSAEAKRALDPACSHTLDSLSQAVRQALDKLVALAGGWVTRPARRRLAYDSDATRKARRRLDDLLHLERLSQSGATSPGSWPRQLMHLLDALQKQGISLPRTSLTDLRLAVAQASHAARQELAALVRQMRQARSTRWRATLPQTWKERPLWYTIGSQLTASHGALGLSFNRMALSASPRTLWTQ